MSTSQLVFLSHCYRDKKIGFKYCQTPSFAYISTSPSFFLNNHHPELALDFILSILVNHWYTDIRSSSSRTENMLHLWKQSSWQTKNPAWIWGISLATTKRYCLSYGKGRVTETAQVHPFLPDSEVLFPESRRAALLQKETTHISMISQIFIFTCTNHIISTSSCVSCHIWIQYDILVFVVTFLQKVTLSVRKSKSPLRPQSKLFKNI